MSIVRVGLAETRNFAQGYDAIFGKKKEAGAKKSTKAGRTAKPARVAARSKPARVRKKTAKKRK